MSTGEKRSPRVLGGDVGFLREFTIDFYPAASVLFNTLWRYYGH